jgi:hypothetical protein
MFSPTYGLKALYIGYFRSHSTPKTNFRRMNSEKRVLTDSFVKTVNRTQVIWFNSVISTAGT